MSQKKKLLQRLFSKPKDFTWEELRTTLIGLGFEEISGEGSRYKFQDSETLIIIHKPHPGNVVKGYVLKYVIETLEARGIRP